MARRRNKPRQQIARADDPGNLADQQPELVRPSSGVAGYRREETRFEFHSGPLPSPEQLARYNDLHPDFAERLLTQFEEQGRHRRELERKVIFGRSNRAWAGLFVAGPAVLTTIVGAIFLIWQGHDGAGVALVSAALGAPSVVYLVGRQSEQKELQEKAQDLVRRKR